MQVNHYTLLKEEYIEEMNGTAYLLSHDKTKAKVLAVKNDDKNKVFTIGFRTPPKADTGVPHIIEHSVLCGSRKFPAKDPFVELAKGSLNTFLNAMTYPDKTVYPIASINDKDFRNLMDVYLDAVFYPNIYRNDKILKQEGWHYHIEHVEDDITYNGVVYNEMKGAYSSAEQQLMHAIQVSLLPDTPYGYDSGGDPKAIPTLTSEAFLEFHKTYYHPSNSYIYLYGDLDMEKELAFIDDAYLKEFDYLEIDSRIGVQPSFDAPKEVVTHYAISDTEEAADNSYLTYNVVVGNSLDRRLSLAFTLLDYALLDVPGAPIKKALVDAGLSNDVFSSYDNSICQPVYSIIAKGCREEEKERFVQVIEETLSRLIENGLEEKMLRAAINHFEFKLKEANYGNYPKGLMYGLTAFDSWLYDDEKPFEYLKYNKIFEFLKSQVGTDYYVNLLREYLLDNTHKTIVIGVPEKGLNQEIDKKTAEQLKAYKDSLTSQELEELVKQTEELNAYQSEPSTEEELRKIPMLELSDLSREPYQLKNRESEAGGVPVITHDIFTNGIAYVEFDFSLNRVPLSLFPYVSLLVALYKEVDTKHYQYADLANEIDLKTGGIGFSLTTVGLPESRGEYKVGLSAKTKVLYENIEDAFSLIEEILFTSDITNKKRMKEVIAELVSEMRMSIMDSGHITMANRALSYISKAGYLKELTDGLAFYEFADDLNQHFEERYEDTCNKLKEAIHAFAKPKNLMISYTGKENIEDSLARAISSMSRYMNEDLSDEEEQNISLEILNEGYKTSSKIQYVATAGNYVKKGFSHNGALLVLQKILSYDYLWINVRVRGGAYGCMCNFSHVGDSYFTSYRDPNLGKTYDVYKNAPDYVRNFDATDRDMLKYIIGTISKLDTPLTPPGDGSYSYLLYLTGITQEQLKKEREQVLTANPEAIRELAPIIEALVLGDVIAALGNEDVIEKERALFGEVKPLV